MAKPAYDVVVIGGGINGAGIARDAAMRGLRVLLLDKGDWGWATSAKSSKLAHGGLRYLELMEFSLVHEALTERERMLRHAPHLVRPLRFLYPIYPHVAARRSVRVGLFLYDLLSRKKSVPKRDYLGVEETQQLAPGINPDGLTGGATFYDGQFQHPERLIAELVWDARRHGADCRNHTRVQDILYEVESGGEAGGSHVSGRVTGVRIADAHGRSQTITSHTVVNAAGPWVDDVLGELGGDKPPKIRKTKGIHVVVPRFIDVALIVRAARDGRTFFILPWQDHCILGTTDTDYEGDAADAVATPAEVAYLIDAASFYFPDAPLEEVQYTYAGVRSLVNEEGITEGNVTRRHILYDHGREDGMRGLWTLQGGKLTTYRSLAEEAVDDICKHIGKRGLAKQHPTRDALFPGAPQVDWDTFYRQATLTAASDFQLPPGAAEHLVDTYGARWRQVLEADPDGSKRITRAHPHLWCEVTWAVREEDARTLADFMLRRTSLGLARDGNLAVAKKVARRMRELLGTDASWLRQQVAAYKREARTFWIKE